MLNGLTLQKFGFDVCVYIYILFYTSAWINFTDLRKGLRVRRVLKCAYDYDSFIILRRPCEVGRTLKSIY